MRIPFEDDLKQIWRRFRADLVHIWSTFGTHLVLDSAQKSVPEVLQIYNDKHPVHSSARKKVNGNRNCC